MQKSGFLSIFKRNSTAVFPIAVRFLLRQITYLLSVLSAFLLSSCAASDFISQRYDNATGYFNTYYNAKRLFDDAERDVEAIRRATRMTDRSEPVELTPQTKQKFNQVIDKCAKLLQFHSTSKWVDDALFLMGASYFYIGDDPKAERKFSELIATFPSSKLAFKSTVWLAMSMMRQKGFDSATRILDELIRTAQEQEEEEFVVEGMFLLAKVHTTKKNYAQAADLYRRIVETSDDDRSRVRSQLLIGRLFVEQDSLVRASEAYRAVEQLDPHERETFESRYQLAVILNKMGKYEEALQVLTDLRREVKSIEYYPQIDLELANTLGALNRIDEAVDQYIHIDSTYARTEVAAKSYYALALIYEKKLADFTNAFKNYDKAQVEFPKAEITALAKAKRQDFYDYFQYYKQIAHSDSVLAGLKSLADTSAPPPSMARSDSLVVQDTIATANPGDSTSQARNDSLNAAQLAAINTKRAEAMYGLANLFLLNINLPDSAETWYMRVIDEYAGSSYAPRATYSLAEVYRTSQEVDRARAAELYRTLIDTYPDSRYADEAKRILGLNPDPQKDPAENAYARAEALLLDGKVDTALVSLQSLIEKYPQSPVVAKSKYAIGWIYENLKFNPDSALDFYQQVYKEFPNSPYAAAAKGKIPAPEPVREESKKGPTPAVPGKVPEKEGGDADKGTPKRDKDERSP